LASASLLMTLLISSPISFVPLSAAMSAKPPPGGTTMSGYGSSMSAYLSETYFMNSSVRT